MSEKTIMSYDNLYSEIKETLLASRDQAYNAVNFAMVQAYWQIGRIIVDTSKTGASVRNTENMFFSSCQNV